MKELDLLFKPFAKISFMHIKIEKVLDKPINRLYTILVTLWNKFYFDIYIKVAKGGILKWHNQKEDGQKLEQV